MTAHDAAHPSSPLDRTLDVFRVRQYFNVLARSRDLLDGIRRDVGFVDDVRRAILPGTARRRPPTVTPFRSPPVHDVAPLQGRVGVVSTGGSGALASLIGVARALEEAGTQVSVWSLCSGGAMFGFPLAAGLPADEVAEMVGSMDPRDYIDVSWRDLARAVATGGRGWAGLVRGDRLEEFYRRRLGDRTLGELVTPAYAPIWNIERNSVEYLGPKTYPSDSGPRRPHGGVTAAVRAARRARGPLVVRRRHRGHLPGPPGAGHRAADRHGHRGQRLLSARVRWRRRVGLGHPAAQRPRYRQPGADQPAGAAGAREPRPPPGPGGGAARRAGRLPEGVRHRVLRTVHRLVRVAGVHARRPRGDTGRPAVLRAPFGRHCARRRTTGIKELWAFDGNRIAVRFAYESHDDSGTWFRSYCNENWEFDENGLMSRRHASINDLPIAEADRLYHWPQGRRRGDHPGLSVLGL